jgi:hypothetical protein
MLPSNRRIPKKKLSFFLPLLISLIIVIGAILFIRALIPGGGSDQTSNAPVATFMLPSGQACIMLKDVCGPVAPSSENNQLNMGEGVETTGSTRVEVVFQDGSLVRLDGNTAFTIDTYTSTNNKKTIALTLQKGSLWVKVADPGKIDSFTVQLGKSQIAMKDGIFALTRNSLEDIYRGMKGSATITVMNNTTPLATYTLNLGAQLNVTDQLVQELMTTKNVDALIVLDQDFRDSDWYAYNTARDTNMGGEPVASPGNSNGNANDTTSLSAGNDNENSSNAMGSNTPGPILQVLSPTEGSSVSDAIVVIKGTASPDTAKIYVDDYVLQKYVAGSLDWTYKAAIPYGNLVVGKNVFKIYAVDKFGHKSDLISFSFSYTPNSNSNLDTNSNVSTKLSSPVVTAPSTGKEYTTNNSKIVIQGTVDKNANKVFVNGYSLQKFVPGSGQWMYYAYEEYGTLQEGANTYTVYAMDKNGNRSPSITYTIIYQKSSTGSGATLP